MAFDVIVIGGGHAGCEAVCELDLIYLFNLFLSSSCDCFFFSRYIPSFT
jgi:thioredoxin reductase